LGHSAAASGLIAQSLKFDGTITLQISGDGPLAMLVMQCTNELNLRGTVSAPTAAAGDTYAMLTARARCAITVDAGAMERPYQGIVEVRGDALADSLENYYARSVQVPSHLQLVADRFVAGGIILQQVAGGDGLDADDWRRLGFLAATLRASDVAAGIGGDLLHRLFAEDDVRVYTERNARFRCRCSQRRAEEVLRLLGEDETTEACEEQGEVVVTCEYCGQMRSFDAVDVSKLFAVRPLQSSDALH
jgi:molecular chaperone Hsp33